MVKRFFQWILSILFPFKNNEYINDNSNRADETEIWMHQVESSTLPPQHRKEQHHLKRCK